MVKPDAVLVTAWASPWPGAARDLNADPILAPVAFRPNGTLDLPAWAAANGIAPDQFIDLGILPNSALPRLYREMDVGVFPNRCEGGTNLVAMECMACGALEDARRDRADSLARAERGAAFMSAMTWADTARQLAQVIEPYH